MTYDEESSVIKSLDWRRKIMHASSPVCALCGDLIPSVDSAKLFRKADDTWRLLCSEACLKTEADISILRMSRRSRTERGVA